MGWLGAFLFLLFPAFFGVFFGEKVKVEKGEGECEETQRQGDGDKDVEVEVVELVHAVPVVGVEAEDATDADAADVVALVVSIAFATSVSDEVEVVDVGKATASFKYTVVSLPPFLLIYRIYLVLR